MGTHRDQERKPILPRRHLEEAARVREERKSMLFSSFLQPLLNIQWKGGGVVEGSFYISPLVSCDFNDSCCKHNTDKHPTQGPRNPLRAAVTEIF